MLAVALILLVVLIFVACGGGKGGSPPAPVPTATRAGIDFGYYWNVDGQTAATATAITFVHAHDGGNWDTEHEAIAQRIIAQMQDARARGVDRVYLSTGWLTFTAAHAYRGTADLIAFKARLDALDLARSVAVLVPIDEPDIAGLSDAVMTQAYTDTRAAWPGPKILAVYGDHGTPGISAVDWIGHDDYPKGVAAFNAYPPLRPGQSYVILPGGGNPWKADPAPFVTLAFADPRVVAIWSFMYGNRNDPDGTLQLGIGSNGMLPAYAAAGTQIVKGGP